LQRLQSVNFGAKSCRETLISKTCITNINKICQRIILVWSFIVKLLFAKDYLKDLEPRKYWQGTLWSTNWNRDQVRISFNHNYIYEKMSSSLNAILLCFCGKHTKNMQFKHTQLNIWTTSTKQFLKIHSLPAADRYRWCFLHVCKTYFWTNKKKISLEEVIKAVCWVSGFGSRIWIFSVWIGREKLFKKFRILERRVKSGVRKFWKELGVGKLWKRKSQRVENFGKKSWVRRRKILERRVESGIRKFWKEELSGVEQSCCHDYMRLEWINFPFNLVLCRVL